MTFMRVFSIPTVIALLLVLLCAAPSKTSAHGGGITFTSTTTQGYLVDVDYSDYGLYADSLGRLGFNLFADGTRSKRIPFTDLWVRISLEDGTTRGKLLFAGPIINPEYGSSGFSFLFPQAGKYTLDVRYNDANKKNVLDETIAETSFSLDVLPPDGQSRLSFGKGFWVGAILGAIIFSFIAAFAMRLFFLRSKTKSI